jgi:predicted DNA-binding transcriptional regulator YafY
MYQPQTTHCVACLGLLTAKYIGKLDRPTSFILKTSLGTLMSDTLIRQWAMLRTIPRFPKRIDATTIHTRLEEMGMSVSLRTVQRDLYTLAETFPLNFDESKPQGWCWREGASQLEVPSMDAHAALTFNLVEQYMQNLLPRSTLSHMAPWFDAAQGVANAQASTVTKWQEKLRVIPHSFNRIPTQIDPNIQATIYSGLLAEKQLEVTYRALSTGTDAKTYPLHPLGLVVMEQVVYLVCTVKNYQDARFLAVHRIDAARLLEEDAKQPEKFDMDAFISREFGIRMGDVPLNCKRPAIPSGNDAANIRASCPRNRSWTHVYQQPTHPDWPRPSHLQPRIQGPTGGGLPHPRHVGRLRGQKPRHQSQHPAPLVA